MLPLPPDPKEAERLNSKHKKKRNKNVSHEGTASFRRMMRMKASQCQHDSIQALFFQEPERHWIVNMRILAACDVGEPQFKDASALTETIEARQAITIFSPSQGRWLQKCMILVH